MKKRGFTLVELVVVIALIAILAVTLAPRLRDQIAKAADAKAIAILGSLRTQSEIYFAENEEPIEDVTPANVTLSTGEAASTELDVLIDDLDETAKRLFDDAEADPDDEWEDGENLVPIGGSRTTSVAAIDYGGTIGFALGDDGVNVIFSTTAGAFGGTPDVADGTPFDTKKRDWLLY